LVINVEHARGAVIDLAADTDYALKFRGRVSLHQRELPELGLQWASPGSILEFGGLADGVAGSHPM
jgi:hypothetical protein